MRLQVLGCAGAELPGHNMPGFFIDHTVLLDAGTIGLALDFQDQNAIEDIFITHAHLDHIKAIPFFADNLVIREAGNECAAQKTQGHCLSRESHHTRCEVSCRK